MHLQDILRVIEKGAAPVDEETIPVLASLGRVASRTLTAELDMPPFDISALDGFAVKGTGPDFTVKGSLEPASRNLLRIAKGEALFVPTGSPIPRNTRFVMREETSEHGSRVSVRTEEDQRKLWKRGRWLKKRDTLVRQGALITPKIMESLALAGHDSARVYRKPSVGILTTGNELKQGLMVDSNRYLLAGLVQHDGGKVSGTAIAGDDPGEIRTAVAHLSSADLLLVTGGTSKGKKDFSHQALRAAGATFLVQAPPVIPGKTMAFGTLENMLFFILPGNPRALSTLYTVFIRPCLLRLAGRKDHGEIAYTLPSGTDIEKGDDTIAVIPVKLAPSIPTRITRMYADEPDGFILLEQRVRKVRAGDRIKVVWTRKPSP